MICEFLCVKCFDVYLAWCSIHSQIIFSFPPGKSRQHECDIDLFSECTKGIARGGEKRGRVGQVPGKQSRRWII